MAMGQFAACPHKPRRFVYKCAAFTFKSDDDVHLSNVRAIGTDVFKNFKVGFLIRIGHHYAHRIAPRETVFE